MDQITIDKIISGDSSAFSYVYNEYCNQVYSIVLSKIKDEFEAEDIMQEIFIALPHKINSLKNPAAFESWLYKLTKNKTIDYIRKKKNVNFSDLDSKNEEYSFESLIENDNRDFQPEESLDYAETKAIIANIINSLPTEQRDCVALRYMEGLSLQEIAEKTNTPLPTVKSRLKYAKAKIEQEVKALEKKGTKLYGVSGLSILPFLRWMLSNGKRTSSVIFATAMSPAGATIAATAGAVGLSSAVKITIATICTTAIITGATVGTIVVSNNVIKDKDASVSSTEDNEITNDPVFSTTQILDWTKKPQATASPSLTPASTPLPTPNQKYNVEDYLGEVETAVGAISDVYNYGDGVICTYTIRQIINIQSDSVDAFNKELTEKCKAISSTHYNKLNKYVKAELKTSAWIPDNIDIPIITVEVEECDGYTESFTYYLFNIETGEQLTATDILAHSGFTKEQINTKVVDEIKKYYSTQRDNKDQAHIYDEQCENSTIKFYERSARYFYNEQGKLVVRFYCVVNADPGSPSLEVIID